MLNQAKSVKMLESQVQSVYKLLKHAGRFIGLNISPFIIDQSKFDLTAKYGCTHTFDSEEDYVWEGDQIQTMHPAVR